MKITAGTNAPVTYKDRDGNIKQIALKPGAHDYPMLDHKCPLVAAQLRVYQKHGHVKFDELLEVANVVEKPEAAPKPVKKARAKKSGYRGKREVPKKPDTGFEGSKISE